MNWRNRAFNYIAPSLSLLHKGRPDHVVYFGTALGDDMLCTALLKEIQLRHKKNVWMITRHPLLFKKNSDASFVLPITPAAFRIAKYFSRENLKTISYTTFDLASDKDLPPNKHIIASICENAGLKGNIHLRPYLTLDKEEILQTCEYNGFIAIQSSGLDGPIPMKNKQWFSERFAEVVSRLKNTLPFVQLGSASDPPLPEVTVDLRGKTSIRETASVLANSRLYIGNVGFLMHLARAVDCPGVIIYGGREAPWQSGYLANENLISNLSCSPCWLRNKCDFDRACMSSITAKNVIEAVDRQLLKSRSDLPVELFSINAE